MPEEITPPTELDLLRADNEKLKKLIIRATNSLGYGRDIPLSSDVSFLAYAFPRELAFALSRLRAKFRRAKYSEEKTQNASEDFKKDNAKILKWLSDSGRGNITENHVDEVIKLLDAHCPKLVP